MSKAERPALSDQARKILERESANLDRTLAESQGRASTAEELLAEVCRLLNQRSRYFGITGEHFSVQDFEGILVIDALDEALLKRIRTLMIGWIESQKRRPGGDELKGLTDTLLPKLRELSERPVGFEVLYTVRGAFGALEDLLDQGVASGRPATEHAFVHFLLGLVDKYVQSRERPVLRHFSDIAREYSVVTRLKCPCGEEKYEVKMQALCQAADGSPFDRMDLVCRACGAHRSIAFDLPNFKDMYQIS